MRTLGDTTHSRTSLIIGLALAVIAGTAATTGAAVRITSLSLKCGPRGAALVVDGEAVFAADATVGAAKKNGDRYTVSVTVPQTVCGLTVRHMTAFPAGCPVSDIVVKEKPAGSVEMTFIMSTVPDKAPIVKNKESRQLILLSSRAFPESEWQSASAVEVPAVPAPQPASTAKTGKPAPKQSPAPQPVAAPAAAAAPHVEAQPAPAQPPVLALRDISILQRGEVAQVAFDLNSTFSYELKSGKQQLTVTLPGAVNGLGAASYSMASGPVAKIGIKEKKGPAKGLSVTIGLPTPPSGTMYAIESANRLVIMLPHAGAARFAAWSAMQDKNVSAEWAMEAAPAPRPSAAATPSKPVPNASAMVPAAGQDGGASVIPAVGPSASQKPSNGRSAGQSAASPQPAVAGARDSVPAKGVDSVAYTSFGRDPFIPYAMESDPTLANVDNLKLVGILYSHADRIALLQDRMDSRRAFTLRELDLVKDGSVMRINQTNVIFLITEMGISRTFSLELPRDNTIVKPN
jgi:hypothetical protein